MAQETFTMDEAYAIQTEQLTKWSTVLNPTAYSSLVGEANKRNRENTLKDPYKVFRGTNMDQFIHNLMSEYTNPKK